MNYVLIISSTANGVGKTTCGGIAGGGWLVQIGLKFLQQQNKRQKQLLFQRKQNIGNTSHAPQTIVGEFLFCLVVLCFPGIGNTTAAPTRASIKYWQKRAKIFWPHAISTKAAEGEASQSLVKQWDHLGRFSWKKYISIPTI